MKKLLFILVLFTSLSTAKAQRFSNIVYEDFVYVDYIKSVQFYLNGYELSNPMINLQDQNPLLLLFDDLNNQVEDYYYTIIHCDMDWQPSNLNEMEYIDGFSEERINDYEFSSLTLTPYINYSVSIPDRNMGITKTGNYLLVVYKKDRNPIPVITRRFVVYEPKLLVDGQLVRPNKVSKLRTHQEIDFNVYRDPKFPIRSPMQEIRAVVLQNGRWDNATIPLKPFFIRPQQLAFDYQDQIVFEGGKEFRFIDLRSLRRRNFNIASIERGVDGFEVYLAMDRARVREPYVSINDANGRFTIETQDQGDSFLSADYANVLFSYKVDQADIDQDPYILGAFNDWRISEDYRMIYNAALNAYVLKIPLKQGYYNYQYAMVPRDAEERVPSTTETEGNWHETENDYTVLIYYRPFGGRYDQVVGFATINSVRNN